MISPSVIETLRPTFRGPLIQPGDPEYEAARRVYNGMIDRRPGLIARCADVADVIAAIRLAREQDLLVAVRGGGHNGAGLGVCDDGLLLDLSRMRGVRVDPEARVARVAGGCVWGDVDHATHAFGLAVPNGILSTTGVAGLTLGGGTGHLTRRFGLTIDNLLSADVVLADGRFVTASERSHPDLFWALRGGGGNFGVVTSFEFRLQCVDTVVGGPTLWPLERGADVLRWYRDFMLAAPEDLNGFFAIMKVPPAPPFPPEMHGQTVCAVVWCWTGPTAKADEAFRAVRAQKPALYGIHEMPLPMLQSAFDALYPPGLQWYWRADFVEEIPDEAVERHMEFAAKLPSAHSTMHLYPMDGAVHRVAAKETAFFHRGSNWNQVIVGVDPEPGNAAKVTSWTKDYWEAVHPYGAGGAYVNFLMGDEAYDRVHATYGDNYARLVEVKTQYDPDNFFRVNQNIRPEPSAGRGAPPPTLH